MKSILTFLSILSTLFLFLLLGNWTNVSAQTATPTEAPSPTTAVTSTPQPTVTSAPPTSTPTPTSSSPSSTPTPVPTSESPSATPTPTTQIAPSLKPKTTYIAPTEYRPTLTPTANPTPYLEKEEMIATQSAKNGPNMTITLILIFSGILLLGYSVLLYRKNLGRRIRRDF